MQSYGVSPYVYVACEGIDLGLWYFVVVDDDVLSLRVKNGGERAITRLNARDALFRVVLCPGAADATS